MKVFAVPYPIHFDDTMAYGTHHFLTGFKLQCAGREGLLFGPWLSGHPEVREELRAIHLLTADAYSRNLGAAELGEVLVVLTTVEARGQTSLTFCFRVLTAAGRPICCGFQTVVCADAKTGAVCSFPPAMLARMAELSDLDEPPAERSFRERTLAGGRAVASLFSEAVVSTARTFLAQPERALASLLEVQARAPEPEREPVPVPETDTETEDSPEAWLFSGQGTFEPELLGERLRWASAAELEQAASIVRDWLGADGAPLWSGDPERARLAVQEAPELDQVGIFLQNVLGARALLAQGRTPRALVGHSFGELAAVTVAGCADLCGGLTLVCSRSAALRGCEGQGTLLAVAAPEGWVRRVLSARGLLGCALAGRNARDRVTVAGPEAELSALASAMRLEGTSAAFVPSRYPFHHPSLAPAAQAWRRSLQGVALGPPQIPVYSPIGRRLLGGGGALADALCAALVRPFDLHGALSDLQQAGVSRLVDCGTRGSLARLLRHAAPTAQVEILETEGQLAPEPVPAEPRRPVVAVVGTGAVVPGAGSPEALFAQLLEGRTGIVDLAQDPEWADDFFVEGGAPDKTGSGLAGVVRDPDLRCPPGLSPQRYASYSRGQKLLATAAAQALSALEGAAPDARLWCLLGATADGFDDYDLALALEAFSDGDAARLVQAHERLGIGPAPSAQRAPWPAIRAVMEDLLGDRPHEVVVLDAACASSLYAVALGMRALETGQADVVLAGGVFCPGPGNSCLFSQFDGLSVQGCRPFDADADGVVFGEGASVVLLQRLAEVQTPVRAVLRGAGLASDGLSPSANVPRQAGQILAMSRCYESYGLSPASVQVIEAHGTATPVGDSTELKSLAAVFGPHARRPLAVRSSKGLVGHTGWAAGTTSLVALCEAFARDLLPGQAPHDKPSAALDSARGVLEVSTRTGPWPRLPGQPRRAAVDSFGFGGADAHVVLDAPEGARPAGRPCAPPELVVVGAARLDGEVSLPEGVGVLPDIAEDMDGTQTRALAVVGQLLKGLPAELRHDVALVVVHSGKTRRGLEATQRVLAHHLQRRLPAPWRAQIDERCATLRPSGPYTLQGMMPNVAPGRAASRFDLRGPNFTVDGGPDSLDQALALAPLLLGDSARIVLLAVLDGEGASALALTSEAEAAALGLAVRGDLQQARHLLQPAPALRVCTPALVAAPLQGEPRPPQSVVFVAGAEPGLVRELLAWRGGEVLAVLTPPMPSQGDRHLPVSLRDEEEAEDGLLPTDTLHPEAVIAVERLGPAPVEQAAARVAEDRGALELLFLLARRRVGELRAQQLELWSLCAGGARQEELHPVTGLYAGLLKSLARELPGTRLRAVSTDDRPLSEALSALAAERASTEPDPDEIVYRGDRRWVRRLCALPEAPGGELPVGPGSVVLATGGARGITAELLSPLLQAGATVIALGRSAPAPRPPELGTGTELSELERAYYAREAERSPELTPRELRQRFQQAQASWEVQAQLDRLPGVLYRQADVCDPADVDRVVAELAQRHGRLDLVVHGAGVQHSARLERRTLAMLRSTLDVKLTGLHHVLAACQRHLGSLPPVHALTSAYSVFGNDGQPDYGAANEALDRLCALGRSQRGASWSSVAWLAWDGVGMTRGSEYRALAKARELTGLTPQQGRELFVGALRGPVAVTVPLSESEQRRYELQLHELPDSDTSWVRFHEVRGKPTLPGAFALDRLLQAALVGGEGETAVLEDIRFEHFARWGGHASPVLRALAEQRGEWFEAKLVGDLAHASGVVLQRGVRFCRARLALRDDFEDAIPWLAAGQGSRATDPYCAPEGTLRLSGPFDCLRRIEIGPQGRWAWFEGISARLPGQALPALLLDAAWRLGAMHAEGIASTLYVPVSVGRVTVRRGAHGALQLRASAPQVHDDIVRCPCVEAVDASGRVVLRAEDSVARRLT
jgi:acyl transferase domain-containing protein/NAD(P)-dependent dehydrogenase (short-subunit alcohol dehydrogenase family)/acyl-CoA thioesterase FadM